jgi:metallo-beta-lactamase class B
MPRRAKGRAVLTATLVASLTALGMAGLAEQRATAAETVPVTLEGHIRAATKAAGLDLFGILTLCLPREPGGTPRPADDRAPPTKVFDNLYYLGMKSVSAWALTTSDGIILIDTLDNPSEAETFIEGGLRQLRLDPAQIKYIIITHGHADHYGGAQYLADKYKAELVMSEADWAFLERPQTAAPRPDRGPIPKRGRAVKDGDRLTLGDMAIELYVAGLWGGTAFNFEPTGENFTTYASSAERFAKIAADKGADVPLSNHPSYDDTLTKIAALKSRAPDKHPFATGPMTVARYMTVAAECAHARARALVEPAPSDPSGLLR